MAISLIDIQSAVQAARIKWRYHALLRFRERRGSQLYLFQNVPAQVCSVCGEIWIEETVLQEVDRLIESGEPVREIKTPVFDLALNH